MFNKIKDMARTALKKVKAFFSIFKDSNIKTSHIVAGSVIAVMASAALAPAIVTAAVYVAVCVGTVVIVTLYYGAILGMVYALQCMAVRGISWLVR